jgi:hypothetical protein
MQLTPGSNERAHQHGWVGYGPGRAHDQKVAYMSTLKALGTSFGLVRIEFNMQLSVEIRKKNMWHLVLSWAYSSVFDIFVLQKKHSRAPG